MDCLKKKQRKREAEIVRELQSEFDERQKRLGECIVLAVQQGIKHVNELMEDVFTVQKVEAFRRIKVALIGVELAVQGQVEWAGLSDS